MKYLILIIFLGGCIEKKEEPIIDTGKPMLMTPEQNKQWILDGICKKRKHLWNQVMTGEAQPEFHQTVIDYKDSTVLFNERIHISHFDCLRCNKTIYNNDTVIIERTRVLPPVEFKPDTTQLVYLIPTNHLFTPNPPVKR